MGVEWVGLGWVGCGLGGCCWEGGLIGWMGGC